MAARSKRKAKTVRRVLAAGVLLAAVVLALLLLSVLRGEDAKSIASKTLRSVHPGITRTDPAQFEDKLREIAARFGAGPVDIKVRPSWKGSPQRWTISVPANQSLLKCNLAVCEEVKRAGGRVEDAREGFSSERTQHLRMQIVFGERTTHTIQFQRSGDVAPALRVFMAIVIDDLGYGNSGLMSEFLALEYPLTFSVLPGYRGSRAAQDAVVASGKEVLLHLPMEPHGFPGIDPGKNPIVVDLSEGQIRDRIGKHLNTLPKVCGINNHMGSLATQDPDVMRAVLKFTKDRGLFFLDSRTASGTVGKQIAREVGAVCLESDMFLDTGRKQEKEVRKMFEKAEKIALARGKAIVIGHLYPGTLNVLKEKLPELEEAGIKLVPLSYFAGTSANVL